MDTEGLQGSPGHQQGQSHLPARAPSTSKSGPRLKESRLWVHTHPTSLVYANTSMYMPITLTCTHTYVRH